MAENEWIQGGGGAGLHEPSGSEGEVLESLEGRQEREPLDLRHGVVDRGADEAGGEIGRLREMRAVGCQGAERRVYPDFSKLTKYVFIKTK